MEQQKLAISQFGNAAESYLTSPVHARGRDLERLSELVGRIGPVRALDLGCGAGHASFALASGGARATACDPSVKMLEVVSREAGRRSLGIETVRAQAEELPFEDASFDLLVTRYSAHHWPDVGKALSEMARVTAPSGMLVVIDSVSPENPLFDTVLQTVEFLRDVSHVRDYRISEWLDMMEKAGFSGMRHDNWKVPIDFESWVERIETPKDRVVALKSAFASISSEARNHFGVSEDFSFAIDAAWIEAVREK